MERRVNTRQSDPHLPHARGWHAHWMMRHCWKLPALNALGQTCLNQHRLQTSPKVRRSRLRAVDRVNKLQAPLHCVVVSYLLCRQRKEAEAGLTSSPLERCR